MLLLLYRSPKLLGAAGFIGSPWDSFVLLRSIGDPGGDKLGTKPVSFVPKGNTFVTSTPEGTPSHLLYKDTTFDYNEGYRIFLPCLLWARFFFLELAIIFSLPAPYASPFCQHTHPPFAIFFRHTNHMFVGLTLL